MRKIMTVLSGVTLLVGIALNSAAIAQQPNPAAQLSVVVGQKAKLEAQQQAALAEIERYRAALENLPARIQALTAQENLLAQAATNPALVMGQAWAQGKSPAVVAGEALTRNVDVRNSLNTARVLQTALPMQIAELTAATAQRGGQIAQLDSQIEQLERTIAYNRNPLQGDLANEQAHLDNLNRQKDTGDEGDQRAWDIKNTQERIRQIRQAIEEYNEAKSASGAGASGQSQGSYGTPAAGTSGTGTQSQSTGGYGPYLGAPPVYGSPMPTHQQLQLPPRTTGGSSGGSSSTSSPSGPSAPPAVTGPAVAGAKPPVSPPSGATCGPASSCTCSDGGRGHIPCDRSIGRCARTGGVAC